MFAPRATPFDVSICGAKAVKRGVSLGIRKIHTCVVNLHVRRYEMNAQRDVEKGILHICPTPQRIPKLTDERRR